MTSLPHTRGAHHEDGFTRIDLLVTVVTVVALGLLIVPSLGRTTSIASAVSCIDNQQQLGLAWQQYAIDHNDRLVNNFNIPEVLSTIQNGQFDTWALNMLDWSTASSNTNLDYLQKSKLFPYLQGNTLAFKCPADTFLSTFQTAAHWTRRVRSYSMNASMGKNGATDSSATTGVSEWIFGKRQFLKTVAIPDPANTIVFLDEHPDSINDGFFLNQASSLQWSDLPGSQHNGGCGVGFADGHGEIHVWVYPGTKVPVRFIYSPPSVTPSTSADFNWVTSRMTVDPTALAIKRRTNNFEIAWSALATNYVLQANADISTTNWIPTGLSPKADYGTKSAMIAEPDAKTFYRLKRY